MGFQSVTLLLSQSLSEKNNCPPRAASVVKYQNLIGSSGGQPLEVTGKVRCKSGAVPQLC